MATLLADVLACYRVGEFRSARRTEHGFVNDNWIVETSDGRFFLKRRHPALRQPDRIRDQHRLTAHLRRAGFPAPAVVPTAAGDTIATLGGALFELYEYVEGEPCQPDRPEHRAEAAVTLARYHQQSESYDGLRCPDALYHPAILKSALTRLTTGWRLEQHPTLAEIARQLGSHAQALSDRFDLPADLPRTVIHGDYYAGNLLFRGDRIVAVVDWDKARWEPRVVELAEAAIYFSAPRPGPFKYLVYSGCPRSAPLAHFLQIYGRAASPTADEWRVLPDAMARIWLSVSLQRLAEQAPRPAHALEALQEVLALVQWAEANGRRLVTLGEEPNDQGHHL